MKKWLDIFWSMLTNSRMKSLYWRTSMMLLAGVTMGLSYEIKLIPDIPVDVAVFLGLVFGEISKSLNQRYGNIK